MDTIAEIPGRTDLFVAGEWVRPGRTTPVLDKFTGETVTEMAAAGPQEVAAAVAACDAAARAGAPEPWKRAEILAEAARLLKERTETFASAIVIDSGFTRADATREVSRAVQTLLVSAEEARRFEDGEMVPMTGAPGQTGRLAFTMRSPVGVVAAITPFNSPLNTVLHKVAPAFGAGNAVLLKPAGHTPLTGSLVVELMLDAGVPPGLVAFIPGSGAVVGPTLLAEERVRFFTFTGSTDVGLQIQAGAGLRRTQLELGSIAFTVAMDDADLSSAIPLIADASFRKAGQVCTSIQVLLVHRSILSEATERLVEKTRTMPFGDNRKPDTLVGPMIAEKEAARAERWVEEALSAGARALTGARREKSVMEPTILVDVPAGQRVLTEEIFAPVVSIVPFDTFEEAIDKVNATPYGLATGVFTRDIDRAMTAARRLEVGGVHINNTCSSRVDLMPYGGVKASGFGREGPRYAMREMSEEKIVTITPVPGK